MIQGIKFHQTHSPHFAVTTEISDEVVTPETEEEVFVVVFVVLLVGELEWEPPLPQADSISTPMTGNNSINFFMTGIL